MTSLGPLLVEEMENGPVLLADHDLQDILTAISQHLARVEEGAFHGLGVRSTTAVLDGQLKNVTGTWRPGIDSRSAVVAGNFKLLTERFLKAARMAPVTAARSVRPPIWLAPLTTVLAAVFPSPFPTTRNNPPLITIRSRGRGRGCRDPPRPSPPRCPRGRKGDRRHGCISCRYPTTAWSSCHLDRPARRACVTRARETRYKRAMAARVGTSPDSSSRRHSAARVAGLPMRARALVMDFSAREN
jgi:hypothetical protein